MPRTATRSAPLTRRIVVPTPEIATPDSVFDFACAVGSYDYTKRLGVEPFEWADQLLDRFEESGDLPEDRDALLALPFVIVRMLRFSTFDTDDELEALMPAFRAILGKLHNMGVGYVDIHQ
jgi:hypothetical protein